MLGSKVRVVFKISSLFNIKNPISLFPVNSISLEYFDPCTRSLAEVIGKENEINCLNQFKLQFCSVLKKINNTL